MGSPRQADPAPRSPQSLLNTSGASLSSSSPRIDGKEFFRQARCCAHYAPLRLLHLHLPASSRASFPRAAPLKPSIGPVSSLPHSPLCCPRAPPSERASRTSSFRSSCRTSRSSTRGGSRARTPSQRLRTSLAPRTATSTVSPHASHYLLHLPPSLPSLPPSFAPICLLSCCSS